MKYWGYLAAKLVVAALLLRGLWLTNPLVLLPAGCVLRPGTTAFRPRPGLHHRNDVLLLGFRWRSVPGHLGSALSLPRLPAPPANAQ